MMLSSQHASVPPIPETEENSSAYVSAESTPGTTPPPETNSRRRKRRPYQRDHDVKPATPTDMLSRLPLEIFHSLFPYLAPREDLLPLSMTSRHIQLLCQPRWWFLCMDRFYESAPRSSEGSMTRKERRRNWRDAFRDMGGFKDEPMPSLGKERVYQTPPWILQEEAEQAERKKSGLADKTLHKIEMRAYYKTVRAKPRDKGPKREIRDKTGWWNEE